MTSSGHPANAEEQRDRLAKQLRQRLAAHDSTAACYQRFAPELSYGRHRGPAGPDARPAAVVAHGLGASHDQYLPLAQQYLPLAHLINQ